MLWNIKAIIFSNLPAVHKIKDSITHRSTNIEHTSDTLINSRTPYTLLSTDKTTPSTPWETIFCENCLFHFLVSFCILWRTLIRTVGSWSKKKAIIIQSYYGICSYSITLYAHIQLCYMFIFSYSICSYLVTITYNSMSKFCEQCYHITKLYNTWCNVELWQYSLEASDPYLEEWGPATTVN